MPGRSVAQALARALVGRRRLIVVGLVALLVAAWFLPRPSNDRDWTPNEAVLPWAEFAGDRVLIHNVRNTVYRSDSDYTPAYEDRTYALDRLHSVWFLVVPFGDWGGAAHTFVSFGFDDGQYVAISVEARKERGETYHFLKGLFKQYEIMYVVADERDVIGLRVRHRGDRVYLYPVRTTPERMRALFVAMLERATRLRAHPAFYNTITRNCTNSIVRHVNALVPGRIPFSLNVVFPGHADRLAYDLGLIDTDLPFERIRERFLVNARALAAGEGPGFSTRLRAAAHRRLSARRCRESRSSARSCSTTRW